MGQAIRGRAEEESAGWIVEEGEAGKNTMKRDQCEPFCSRSRVHARYKVLYRDPPESQNWFYTRSISMYIRTREIREEGRG